MPNAKPSKVYTLDLYVNARCEEPMKLLHRFTADQLPKTGEEARRAIQTACAMIRQHSRPPVTYQLVLVAEGIIIALENASGELVWCGVPKRLFAPRGPYAAAVAARKAVVIPVGATEKPLADNPPEAGVV